MKFRLTVLAAALVGGAACAGTLDLSFVEPDRYVDAGVDARDRQETLTALSRHLELLARRSLGPAQHLKLEVLDIDRVGRLQHTSQIVDGWVRVARAGVDWPLMHVRYTLFANGQALRTGDEWIKDMDFARGVWRDGGDPLFYEKRMLSRWFREEFAPQSHAAVR